MSAPVGLPSASRSTQRMLTVACGACKRQCRTYSPQGERKAAVRLAFKCPACGVANEFTLQPLPSPSPVPAEPQPAPPFPARPSTPPSAPRPARTPPASAPRARAPPQFNDVDYSRVRLAARANAPEYTPADPSGRSLRKRRRVAYDDRHLEAALRLQLRADEEAWQAAERRRVDATVASAFLLPAHALCSFECTCRSLPPELRRDVPRLIALRNRVLSVWQAQRGAFLRWETLAAALELAHSADAGARDAECRDAACVLECLTHHGVVNAGIVDGHPAWAAPAADAAMCTPRQATGASGAPPAPAGAARHAIVVGAGLAGLAAARQLHGMGWRVSVLEARARLGGRVHSQALLGCSVELGAMVLTGQQGNPLAEVCARAALGSHELCDGLCRIYGPDGALADGAADAQVEAAFNADLAATKASVPPSAGAGGSEGSARASLGEALHAARRSREQAAEAGAAAHEPHAPQPPLAPAAGGGGAGGSGLRELLYRWHVSNLEYGLGAPVHCASNHFWDYDDRFEFGGPHSVFPAGFGRAAEALADGLCVRTGTVVTAIEQHASGVRVRVRAARASERPASFARLAGAAAGTSATERRAAHGSIAAPPAPGAAEGVEGEAEGEEEELVADAVVVTLPLGVLKAGKVSFSPPLPAPKLAAIGRLGFGVLNKVYLRFSKPFWEEAEGGSDYFGFMPPASEEQGCCYLFWNLQRMGGGPALLALLAGRAALCGGGGGFERAGAAEAALRALRRIFGEAAVREPLAVHVTAWETDPFSLGSYSHIAAGASPADYDTLALPHGAVHFAGEATCSTHPATASGAYLSGLRAAGELLCAAVPTPAGASGEGCAEREERGCQEDAGCASPPSLGRRKAPTRLPGPDGSGSAPSPADRALRPANPHAGLAPPASGRDSRRRGASRLPAAEALHRELAPPVTTPRLAAVQA